MTNLPFETWVYEDQTKMKHYVFADYIDKWIKIVGKYNKLNYIDGYSGIGAYQDQKGRLYYGSPILVCQAIERITSRNSRDVKVLIIDSDKKNLKNIQKILSYLKVKITPDFINKDFDESINNILNETPNITPTFVFIDPFGFKIKMSTLRRIMQIDKSEILLNFMFTRINQFLAAPQVENTCTDLFGDDTWKQFKNTKGVARENGIIEYYRNKLKELSKFVYYYRLEFPAKDKTYYYLIHLTNHYLGCSIMKSSFAKFNYGRVEYRGIRAGQMELFEQASIKETEVADMLLKKYTGRRLIFKNIVEENIDSTEYLESQMRNAIKSLEVNGNIKIQRIPENTPTGKKRKSIGENDSIVF